MRVPAFGWGLVATFLGMVWGGCPHKDLVDMSPRVRDFKPEQYKDIRKRWTRNRLVIRTFDSVINTTVTYLSPEFVSAYVARYAEDYRMTRAERQRLLAARLAEVRTHHEFYMAATTADRAWNDFHRKKSIWRITLEDDRGTRVRPLSIKKLRVNQVHRHYFPYTSVFHKGYLLKFPRIVGGKPFITPSSKFFKLMITSPMGSARLVWFIKTDGKSQPKAPPAATPTRPEPTPPARRTPEDRPGSTPRDAARPAPHDRPRSGPP